MDDSHSIYYPERRRFWRFLASYLVEYKIGDVDGVGVMGQLSLGGMFLRDVTDLSTGNLGLFLLYLADKEPLALKGIIRSTINNGVGIEFIDNDDNITKKLRSFVEEIIVPKIEKSLSIQNITPDRFIELGSIYKDLERYDDSLTMFRKGLERYPRVLRLYECMGFILLWLIENKIQHPDTHTWTHELRALIDRGLEIDNNPSLKILRDKLEHVVSKSEALKTDAETATLSTSAEVEQSEDESQKMIDSQRLAVEEQTEPQNSRARRDTLQDSKTNRDQIVSQKNGATQETLQGSIENKKELQKEWDLKLEHLRQNLEEQMATQFRQFWSKKIESIILTLQNELKDWSHRDQAATSTSDNETEPSSYRTFLSTNKIEATSPTHEDITKDINVALHRFSQNSKLFALLDDAGLQRLAKIATAEKYAQDVTIIKQGDGGDTFYLIAHGEVKILVKSEGQEKDIARLEAGFFFGEIGVLTNQPRTATVRTTCLSELIAFRRDDVLQILNEYPKVKEIISAVGLKRTEKNIEHQLSSGDSSGLADVLEDKTGEVPLESTDTEIKPSLSNPSGISHTSKNLNPVKSFPARPLSYAPRSMHIIRKQTAKWARMRKSSSVRIAIIGIIAFIVGWIGYSVFQNSPPSLQEDSSKEKVVASLNNETSDSAILGPVKEAKYLPSFEKTDSKSKSGPLLEEASNDSNSNLNTTKDVPVLSLSPKQIETIRQHMERGHRLLKENKPYNALESYKKALVIDAENGKIHRSLGIAYSLLGMPKRAIGAYRKYLYYEPDAVDAKDIKQVIDEFEKRQRNRGSTKTSDNTVD